MSDRIFGQIPGIEEGYEFQNRIELSVSGVHRPRQAGISGGQNEGADSIVLSGGYEDDEDHGSIIIYTGHGGRDLNSGKQIMDQELVRGNLALAKNCQLGLPVRVIRGAQHESEFSPIEGYRYDGLFRVTEYWKEKGISGFIVWRFRLEKIEETQQLYSKFEEDETDYKLPNRSEVKVQRIIRDSTLATEIKALYNYQCQICNKSIKTNTGKYIEAAHIKPLGKPHNGPDIKSNIICLCPNHHVMFDFGGFAILDNFELIGIEGKLTINPNHKIDLEFIRYHREHFYEDEII